MEPDARINAEFDEAEILFDNARAALHRGEDKQFNEYFRRGKHHLQTGEELFKKQLMKIDKKNQ